MSRYWKPPSIIHTREEQAKPATMAARKKRYADYLSVNLMLINMS